MALPIMKHPTFELTVPSTKETLKYRPFLVKEEKILLLAQGSNNSKDLISAVKQIGMAKLELDLNLVEVQHNEGHTNIIKLDNDVHLEMKYPTYTTLSSLETDDIMETTFGMIEKCIDKVVQGEEVMELKDFSKAEVKEFLDSLTSQNFRDIQKFFDEMPKLQHTVEYKVGKKTKSRTFTGLADFFQSA